MGPGRGHPAGGPSGPHPDEDDVARRLSVEEADQSQTISDEATPRLGRASYLCDLRHDADQTATGAAPVVEPGVVSRWRMKDRVSVLKSGLSTCKLSLQWDSHCACILMFMFCIANLAVRLTMTNTYCVIRQGSKLYVTRLCLFMLMHKHVLLDSEQQAFKEIRT